MRVLLYVILLCFVFVSVRCRHRQRKCPYGISALTDIVPVSVLEDKINHSEKQNKEFIENLDENIKDLREFIATQNLTSDQPLHYILFTNKNPTEEYYMTFDKQNLKESPYDGKNPTVFMMHGLAPTRKFYENTLIGTIKEGLLDNGDYNVIYPDFSSTINNSYFDSIRNGYLVSRNVSDFIYFLKENTPTELQDIQLIGLSIGAQIIGIIGDYTPGLGRISSLDPSMLIYAHLPPDLRLSPHDADFVDVIHTNGEDYPYGMGLYTQSGTLDFYVNGGRSQTNCNSTEPITEVPTDGSELEARLCMHDRAVDYFVTSMCKGCKYIGVACESYEQFEMGICNKYNSITAVMGQYATKPTYPLPASLKFFVDTDDDWPYCRNTTKPRHFV